MITSVRLVNFKNFRDETLLVGPFTLIVGTNASGKSNIRDAFRFLHGIGRGYTLAEIIGGKYGAGGYNEWAEIRGAMDEIIRFGQSTFSVTVEARVGNRNLTYSIEAGYDVFRSNAPRVVYEELRDGIKTVYKGRGLSETVWVDTPEGEERGDATPQPFRNDQPVLLQETALLGEGRLINENPVRIMRSVLTGIRFLDPVPNRMREPSFPGQDALGDSGDSLPTVIEGICKDRGRKDFLLSWLQELTPMDVRDFQFLRDPSGRTHFRILERNGRSVSAYSTSDGTLRFLAILAALMEEKTLPLYFLEELENGLHPNRLWLLLDLIERQTRESGLQVIATTHSPDLLNTMNDETFENASVVARLDDTDDAIIRPVRSLHNATKLRDTQGLGRLHQSGWMEDILNLAAWTDEDEQVGE